MSQARRLLLILLVWLALAFPAAAIAPASRQPAGDTSAKRGAIYASRAAPASPVRESESRVVILHDSDSYFAEAGYRLTAIFTPAPNRTTEIAAPNCLLYPPAGRHATTPATHEALPFILRPGIRAYPSSPRDPPLL